MNKEYYILIFDRGTSMMKQLRIYDKVFKVGFSLLAIALLFITLFFFDYIKIRNQNFHLNRLHQEIQTQKLHIQFFSTRIKDLEKQISKLKEFDRRIQKIANLERSLDMTLFIGLGGSNFSAMGDKLSEKEGSPPIF